MSSVWTTTFRSILDLHQKAVITADSQSAQCHVVKKVQRAILAAYEEQEEDVTLPTCLKKNAKKRFSVSSSGIKEWAATGFESFAEWSTSKFYPSKDEDPAGSDNKDDENGPVIPEIILDDDEYATLLVHDGIGLKGQHELIRDIFHASYKVCIGGTRPVPWGAMTARSSNYLERGSVPTGFVVQYPSHMKKREVNHTKVGDLWDNKGKGQSKRKSMEKRVNALDSDEEDLDWPVSLNSSHFTQRTTQLATNQLKTTPDNVSIKDQYKFLESLSKNKNYLELIDAIRDLAKLANQKFSTTSCLFNIIADMSNSQGSYLPEDVHASYDTFNANFNKLQTSIISGTLSVMPVILKLGLLYRESKRVIEFEEDEADPNTPSYLPNSAFNLQFLVALNCAVADVLSVVVEHIERLTAC
ncbi:hypothetical protein BDR04DRAFT_1156621 [Suillus decipiens]|nr:hypothetical protein BDR04DRAFT_1156621 [Suillus decipiens]